MQKSEKNISMLAEKVAITLRTIPLVLLIVCQANSANATGHTEEAELTEEAARLKALGNAVRKHYTIHHGGFRELRTGQTREGAFEVLGRMNIYSITVRLRPQQEIEKPEDVHLLQNAEAIALNDSVFVEFSGNDVIRFNTPTKARRIPRDGLESEKPRHREEVLDFLRRFLKAYPGSHARSATRLPFHYKVAEGLHQRDGRLLFYPGWFFHITDGEGWWHLVLWFDNDVLDDIEISFSPIELP